MPPFRNYKKFGNFGKGSSNTYKKPKQEIENLNAQYLVIVESPSKCPKIAQYLGEQYQVIASIGHIRELTSLKNAFDPSSYSSSVVVSTPPHSTLTPSETIIETEPNTTDQTVPKKRGRPPKSASNILIPTPAPKKATKKAPSPDIIKTPIFLFKFHKNKCPRF